MVCDWCSFLVICMYTKGYEPYAVEAIQHDSSHILHLYHQTSGIEGIKDDYGNPDLAVHFQTQSSTNSTSSTNPYVDQHHDSTRSNGSLSDLLGNSVSARCNLPATAGNHTVVSCLKRP